MASSQHFFATCFRNVDSLQLFGKLKQTCEDFEVYEIDIEGRIAGVDTDFPSVDAKPLRNDRGDVSKASSKNNAGIDAETEATEKSLVWEQVAANPSSYLKSLISEATYDSLAATRDYGNYTDSSPIALGAFNDKFLRATIHEAVRYEFPYLVLTTGRVNENVSMSALVDSKWIEFRNCLGMKDAQVVSDDKEACKEISKIGKNTSVFANFASLIADIFRFMYCRNIRRFQTDSIDDQFEGCINTLDKNERKKLHHLISKHFGKLIESKTMSKNDQTILSLRFKEKRVKAGEKRKHGGSIGCIRVTLYKKNLELLTALQKLATELDVKLSAIKYAGIKDKKAVTHQFLSITGGVSLLRNVVNLSLKTFHGWSISYPHACESELQIGRLKGNLFRIVLRDVKMKETDFTIPISETVRQSCRNVSDHGFLNYFGPQRFGEDLSSAKIGLLLLKKQYMKAVQLLLQPSSKYHLSDSTRRRFNVDLTSGDVETTLKRRHVHTGSSASHDKSCQNDEENDSDFDSIYQSKLLFTEQKDIKGALKLMPFHKTRERLVLQALNRYSYTEDGCLKAFLNIPYAMRLFFIHSYCSLLWNQVISERINAHGFHVLPGDLVINDETEAVEFISENDLQTKDFSLENIVFPLPGFSMVLPKNQTKDVYERLLIDDGILISDFRLKELGFNVAGAYRTPIVKPTDFEVVNISDANIKNGGELAEIVLKFRLPSSSYATMLIRELLHEDSITER